MHVFVSEHVISISNGTFAWTRDTKPCLSKYVMTTVALTSDHVAGERLHSFFYKEMLIVSSFKKILLES